MSQVFYFVPVIKLNWNIIRKIKACVLGYNHHLHNVDLELPCLEQNVGKIEFEYFNR